MALISNTVQMAEYHSIDLLYTKIFFFILIIDIIISVITDLIIRLVASLSAGQNAGSQMTTHHIVVWPRWSIPWGGGHSIKLCMVLLRYIWPTHIQIQVRMTRIMHPMHFIQIQTTANYYKYTLSSLWPSYSGTISVRWHELIQVNHLQPKSYHAINPEKMYYQLLTFYFF